MIAQLLELHQQRKDEPAASDTLGLRQAFLEVNERLLIEDGLFLGQPALHAHLGLFGQVGRHARMTASWVGSLLRIPAVRREEEASYLSAVRARIEDLERILREDLHGPETSPDVGWDDASLREEFGEG